MTAVLGLPIRFREPPSGPFLEAVPDGGRAQGRGLAQVAHTRGYALPVSSSASDRLHRIRVNRADWRPAQYSRRGRFKQWARQVC
jgi:hypothetical protein